MSGRLVARIGRDGVIGVLHDDRLRLHELGRVRSRRVSHVEFDGDRQAWAAILVDGEEVAASPIRADCIEAEIARINDLVRDGAIETMFGTSTERTR